MAFVPSVAGLIIAGEVVKDIIRGAVIQDQAMK
jgi:tRNA A37 threonylcarbamoyladenosine dehydratase